MDSFDGFRASLEALVFGFMLCMAAVIWFAFQVAS